MEEAAVEAVAVEEEEAVTPRNTRTHRRKSDPSTITVWRSRIQWMKFLLLNDVLHRGDTYCFASSVETLDAANCPSNGSMMSNTYYREWSCQTTKE